MNILGVGVNVVEVNGCGVGCCICCVWVMCEFLTVLKNFAQIYKGHYQSQFPLVADLKICDYIALYMHSTTKLVHNKSYTYNVYKYYESSEMISNDNCTG